MFQVDEISFVGEQRLGVHRGDVEGAAVGVVVDAVGRGAALDVAELGDQQLAQVPQRAGDDQPAELSCVIPVTSKRSRSFVGEGEARRLGAHTPRHVDLEDRETKAPFDAARGIGAKVHAAGVERGLFSRVRGDVYCIAPPIVTPEETIDRIPEILAESVRAVLG